MTTVQPDVKELTIRGVFTAANVYFGLKAGITLSTSIPA